MLQLAPPIIYPLYSTDTSTMSPPPPPSFTSHPLLPYTSPALPLRTLDLHIPITAPSPSAPSYTLIYIHGGAFRDPLITSESILPSLPHLIPSPQSKNTHITAIASINYRLSPYPTHRTDPSHTNDESRNARWPDHARDVRAALNWLTSNDGGGERPTLPTNCILVGHSVGATIAFALALGLDQSDGASEVSSSCTVKAVVGVEGIYDFVALRDAHLDYRGIYEEFTTAAFGAEKDGGWEQGNMVKAVGEGRELEGVEVVVLAQSREDELVEWGQMEMMGEALREMEWDGGDGKGKGKGKGKEVVVVELKGGHDEVWEKGEELARCIALVVEQCVQRDLHRSS